MKKIKMKNLSIISSFNFKDLDSYIIQGLCIVDDITLVTAYDEEKKKNSKVFVIKNDEVINECILYNNAHVGGIAYDKQHRRIWITDIKGCISAYQYDEIIKYKEAIPIIKMVDTSDNLINNKGDKAAAFVAINNNKLYVGNYTKEHPIIKEYSITSKGISENYNFLPSFNYVQGICFINNYMIVSTSKSRKLKSKILITKDGNIQTTIILPPMSEQICIDKNNNLVVAFESNAKKYKSTVSENTSDLLTIKIDNYLS